VRPGARREWSIGTIVGSERALVLDEGGRSAIAYVQPSTPKPHAEDRASRGGESLTSRRQDMPKYVIEREIPGAGKLSPEQLQGISQKSCGVLQGMGPQIQWVESFVTADKIYCVYIAPSEEMVREHARQGGFPANRVSAVTSIISPTTAE
jgi:hypothetical protein